MRRPYDNYKVKTAHNPSTMSLHLSQYSSIAGEVRIPGSKSLTNRALLLAALCRGRTRIRGALKSEDTDLMREALKRLGVEIDVQGEITSVTGRQGALGTADADLTLDLGLAGTAFRPLTAALTTGQGHYVLDGTQRMRERPIAPLVDALVGLGANIHYLGAEGYPPLDVVATGLKGGRVRLPGDLSSQYLSSLMITAPLASDRVVIEVPGDQVSKPYVDMTVRLMRDFGVEVRRDGYKRYEIQPGAYVSPGEYEIEADASSASYFLAAGAIAGNGLRISNLSRQSLQGDAGFAEVMQRMGARITSQGHATLVSRAPLRGIDVDLNHMPDAAMTLAVAALFADGPTRIRGIANWRIKETDRLEAMRTELAKLGAEVSVSDDAIEVRPPARLQPAHIETYGDHRMAMCFSLACFGTQVEIAHPDVVAKTFPDYFERFTGLLRA